MYVLIYYRLSTVSEDPVPMVFGNRTEREPTPLAEMENPVLDVLESMRVQRMSLVQSLRQFVFAYKGMSIVFLFFLLHSSIKYFLRGTR